MILNAICIMPRIIISFKFLIVFQFALVFLIAVHTPASGQFTKKITQKKHQTIKDSLERLDYPFLLPLWGEKMLERGFDIPYPAGFGLNYYWQTQLTDINNLAVSVGESGDIDISDLVEFEYIRSQSQSISFRPDVYIFPFLSVYGILNRIDTKADVKLSEPFELEIPQTSNEGWGGGFGINLAGGIGPGWISVNGNWAWTKIRNLERPTPTFVSGIRLGMTKYSSNRSRFVAFWIGANYQNYVSDNRGSYDLLNLLPEDREGLEYLREKFQEMIDGANERYEEWCMMPGNRPKCEILDPVFEQLVDAIQDKINGVEPPEELRIGYAFNATPQQKWNMLAGIQFHASRRWQFRTEIGFLGERRTYIVSGNYRFGIKRRSI